MLRRCRRARERRRIPGRPGQQGKKAPSSPARSRKRALPPSRARYVQFGRVGGTTGSRWRTNRDVMKRGSKMMPSTTVPTDADGNSRRHSTPGAYRFRIRARLCRRRDPAAVYA